MDLATGRVKVRPKVVKVPITEAIIKAVEKLADRDQIKTLKFYNRKKENDLLPDADQTTGVEGGQNDYDLDNESDDANDSDDEEPSTGDSDSDSEMDEDELQDLLEDMKEHGDTIINNGHNQHSYIYN